MAALKQHLIDPEVCIRCNTCEYNCPKGAITHARNYVVDPAICEGCGDCLPLCPTGSIDHWRLVSAERPYTVAEQHDWEELPLQEAAATT